MDDITIEHTDMPPGDASITAFAASDLFFRIYDESMALVRQAADYLEQEGVTERQHLSQKMSIIYACESMRLTTRLMQVSAWLLAMRAIRQGEIKAAEIEVRGYRLGAKEVCMGGPVRGAGLLPVRLITLMETSKRLYERVARLDGLLFANNEQPSAHNLVVAQLSRIEQAFSI